MEPNAQVECAYELMRVLKEELAERRCRLGNSKKVNSSQVEVDTDKTMINVSKRLFTSNEYAAIRNFDGEVTRYLESTCLPFERGIHLCPLPLLKQVERKMREFADQRMYLVEA